MTRPASIARLSPARQTAEPLAVDDLTLEIAGRRVLGPITLRLSSPGLTAVLGPNGAGKSMFLRLIHGLAEPTAGRIRWDGRRPAEARSGQGYVFQSPPLMRRSVWSNVEFPLIAARWPRGMRQARAAEALERARLADKAALPAAALSGGERQRMALARAWATGPRTLFLDEPTASLDPASTKELERMLAGFREEGVKLFLATHDLAQARRLAEDVLFFSGGRILEQAAAEPFFAAPSSEAARRYLKGEL